MTIPADSERSLTKSVCSKQHFDDLLSFKRAQSHDSRRIRYYVKTSKLILGQNVINSEQRDFFISRSASNNVPKLNISKYFNLIRFFNDFATTIIERPFFVC